MANLDNPDKRAAGMLLSPSPYTPNGGTPPVGMYASFYRAAIVGTYLPGGGIAPSTSKVAVLGAGLRVSGGLEIAI